MRRFLQGSAGSAPFLGEWKRGDAVFNLIIFKVQEKLVPKYDPVESVIAQAEKEFQSGEANYQAGHLDQAKTNFDRAFDLLLSYQAGVRSDDRRTGQDWLC